MELEETLVAWLNANELSRKVRSLSDLADGVLLYEMMRQIAPKFFAEDVSDTRESFSIRLSNLRKLRSSFERYLSQVHSLPFDESIDLGELARSKNPKEAKKLLELVCYSVISCEQKQKYIGTILSMSQACQGELMVFIEMVLEKIKKPSGEKSDEVIALKQSNEKMTRDLDNLTQELAEERAKQETLKKQLADAKSDSGRARRPDMEKIELEAQLAEKSEAIKTLQGQIDEIKKAHEYELISLRDELDIANEQLFAVSKLEASLESYKKKAEEGLAAKKKLKELQSYNEVLQVKLQQFEDERAAITQTHHSLAVYKDQLTQEKEKSAALSLQLQTKEREVKDYMREKIQWEEKRCVYETKVQRLNEELEKVKYPENSDDSFSSFHKAYDYEETIRNLESENRRLQIMIGNEELVRHFNEQIDAALLSKKQTEDRLKQTLSDFTAIKTTKEDLEVKVQTLESSLALVQSQLKDAEEHGTKLLVEVEKLRTISQENERLKAEKDGYMSDLKQVYREKDELQRKCLEAKEECHHFREELTSLQAKIRELETDKEHAQLKLREMTQGGAGAESGRGRVSEATSATIKQLEIERENLKMSVEISTLKLALREREDEIKDLQTHKRLLEESMQKALRDQKEALTSAQQEDVKKLRGQLEEKDKELEALNCSTDEMKALWFKEEKLMVAVMHEIGIEVFKTKTARDPHHAQVRERPTKG